MKYLRFQLAQILRENYGKRLGNVSCPLFPKAALFEIPHITGKKNSPH